MARETRVIFVGNVPYDLSEEQLTEIFSEVGPIVSFKLVFDRDTGKPRGYGFCEYHDEATAESAVRNLDGTEASGRKLRVDFADSEALSHSGVFPHIYSRGGYGSGLPSSSSSSRLNVMQPSTAAAAAPAAAGTAAASAVGAQALFGGPSGFGGAGYPQPSAAPPATAAVPATAAAYGVASASAPPSVVGPYGMPFAASAPLAAVAAVHPVAGIGMQPAATAAVSSGYPPQQQQQQQQQQQHQQQHQPSALMPFSGPPAAPQTTPQAASPAAGAAGSASISSEVISNALAAMSSTELSNLIMQMKTLVVKSPEEARALLSQHPQLAYALLQALIMMNLVDAESVKKMTMAPQGVSVLSNSAVAAPAPMATPAPQANMVPNPAPVASPAAMAPQPGWYGGVGGGGGMMQPAMAAPAPVPVQMAPGVQPAAPSTAAAVGANPAANMLQQLLLNAVGGGAGLGLPPGLDVNAILQLLNLPQQQIDILPPDQRNQILLLKSQLLPLLQR